MEEKYIDNKIAYLSRLSYLDRFVYYQEI